MLNPMEALLSETPPPTEPKALDTQALSAAISGFLACHVLTLRFLIEQGVVDKDRLLAFLEDAMAEMRPGLADQRSLFVLGQVIASLRAPEGGSPLQ